jgi:hypothetical protein
MSDIMLDIIKRWLTNSVSTSNGSGPPGEVFSAYESLVNERNAAKARVSELEKQLARLKPLELPTEPTRWGVERSPVLEAAMRGNNGPVLMSPPPDGTLARVAELEAGYNVLAKGVLAAKKPVNACFDAMCQEFQNDYESALDLAKETKP